METLHKNHFLLPQDFLCSFVPSPSAFPILHKSYIHCELMLFLMCLSFSSLRKSVLLMNILSKYLQVSLKLMFPHEFRHEQRVWDAVSDSALDQHAQGSGFNTQHCRKHRSKQNENVDWSQGKRKTFAGPFPLLLTCLACSFFRFLTIRTLAFLPPHPLHHSVVPSLWIRYSELSQPPPQFTGL